MADNKDMFGIDVTRVPDRSIPADYGMLHSSPVAAHDGRDHFHSGKNPLPGRHADSVGRTVDNGRCQFPRIPAQRVSSYGADPVHMPEQTRVNSLENFISGVQQDDFFEK